MTVKQLIEYLKQAGNEDSVVVFNVRGTIEHRQDMEGSYFGEYVFPVEIDESGWMDDVVSEKDGVVKIVIEV